MYKRREIVALGSAVVFSGCIQNGGSGQTDRVRENESENARTLTSRVDRESTERRSSTTAVRPVELRRYLRVQSIPSTHLLGDNEHFFLVLSITNDGPAPEDIGLRSGGETLDINTYATDNRVALRIPNGSYPDARLRYGSKRQLDLGSRLRSPNDHLPRFDFHDITFEKHEGQIDVQLSVSNGGGTEGEAFVKIWTSFYSDVSSVLSLPVRSGERRAYRRSPDVLEFDGSVPKSGDIFVSYGGEDSGLDNQFEISDT